jgi:penicillin-binding protein 2
MSFNFFKKKRYLNKDINPEDIFVDAGGAAQFDEDSFEGRFEKPINESMYLFIGAFFLILMSIFSVKAFDVQILESAKWKSIAENNYIKKSPEFALRGNIKDRNGVILAWNETDRDSIGTDIPKRRYVSAAGFSNLLGYVSYPKRDTSGNFWQADFIGMDGVEKQYDQALAGVIGERIYEVSANGKVTKDNIVKFPIGGESLTLNIDSRVQKYFYNHLKEVVDAQNFRGGSAVMMDVNTGDVIAIVSYPEYNNNVYTNATSTEDKAKKQSYLSDKTTPMSNRAIGSGFVPGSVVKPFMAYAALYEGVIDQYKNIFSSGQLVVKNKYGGPDTIFRDWKAHGYTDVRKAIAESSDEYFYQVGGGYQDQEGLGITRIEKYMKAFGFDSVTGIDLPRELVGNIPDPAWKKKNFADGDWLLGDTYHASIGQSGYQTNAIELARSISAIANGGKLVTPKVASTTANNTIDDSKTITDIKIDESILKIVREGMRASAGSEGTAHYFEDLPFKVAAKTGTAQLGYKNEYVNSWSTGYFPYDAPKYAFVFMMEKGPASNTVASSKIMRKVFQDILDNAPEYTK